MDTKTYPNHSAAELQKTLSVHLTKLAEETNNARRSKEMSLYLDFCSKFYAYSPNNIWLILMQRPTASHVAGYHAWLNMGRHVMRGEKGIGILAPLIVKHADSDGKEDSQLVGFKTVHVFDIEQTVGEPIPPQPNWKSLGQNEELRKRLMDFAETKGIQVTFQDLSDGIQGMSLGGKITLSPSSGVKTLIHELAHELLHQAERNSLSPLEKELEAEGTAYIVCRHFDISDLASPNYAALLGGTGDLILQHFQRILGAAMAIIYHVEKQIQRYTTLGE